MMKSEDLRQAHVLGGAHALHIQKQRVDDRMLRAR